MWGSVLQLLSHCYTQECTQPPYGTPCHVPVRTYARKSRKTPDIRVRNWCVHTRDQHQGSERGRVVTCLSSWRARCRPGGKSPSTHILATASVDLLHLGDIRLQGRRAVVSVARALKRRRPVVLQRRQVRRPQVSQVSLVVLLRAAKSRLWPAASARGLASAPAFRNTQAWLAPVIGPGQTSLSYGGTSSLSPKLPMPPSMPMPPMPPMPPIPPAWKSTA